MKKLIIALSCIALVACGKPLDTPTKTYPTYGLLNADSSRSKNVCYEVSIGNVVLSAFFAATIIAPVYFIGFDIMNPVRVKRDKDDSCGID